MMLLDRDDDGTSRYALRAAERFEGMGYRGLAADARGEAFTRRQEEREWGVR